MGPNAGGSLNLSNWNQTKQVQWSLQIQILNSQIIFSSFSAKSCFKSIYNLKIGIQITVINLTEQIILKLVIIKADENK